MADSSNSTGMPRTEDDDHPTDVMARQLERLDGLLNLLVNDFDSDRKNLTFVTPEVAIWHCLLLCSDLVRQTEAARLRLVHEFDVPFHSKAEQVPLGARPHLV